MKLSRKTKIWVLLCGDILALYLSLCVAIAIRYQSAWRMAFWEYHLVPFTVIFPLWIAIFYIAGLYDLPHLRNNIDFIKKLSLTLFVNALLTITIFYFVPYFGIAPKTNLFLFILAFGLCEIWWRRTWNIRASFRDGLNRVLLLDDSPQAKEVVDELAKNPQIGYGINVWLKQGFENAQPDHLRTLVRDHEINLIIVPHHTKNSHEAGRVFYDLLALGVEVIDLPSFYESIFRKVPLSDIHEWWFLENRIGQKKFYDDLKKGIEFVCALALLVLLSPFLLVIALLVKLTSPGPAVLGQTRIGKGGTPFTLYKFRSMKALAADGSAETNGAVWSGTNDSRVTPLGRLLRYSHLDELPQLVNILKGELSFIGPRPERPEIVKQLIPKIPFYEIRLLVKPGVTGWAQINYRKDQTDEDVREKLQHDIYYLKNRSMILDVAIVLKTLKAFFVNHQ